MSEGGVQIGLNKKQGLRKKLYEWYRREELTDILHKQVAYKMNELASDLL